MYNSTLPSTSAIDGEGGQRHTPAALPPGQTGYTLYKRLALATGPVCMGAENLAPAGILSQDRPARSESLYRLSCRGPQHYIETLRKV